jgi:hypothetical protein
MSRRRAWVKPGADSWTAIQFPLPIEPSSWRRPNRADRLNARISPNHLNILLALTENTHFPGNARLAEPINTQPDQIGLIVSTHADFFASVRFPDLLEVGLRVNRLSKHPPRPDGKYPLPR